MNLTDSTLRRNISLEKIRTMIPFYCTVRFTVLVAVAPPLALLAVTIIAEVPAGVPTPSGTGVGVGVRVGVGVGPGPEVLLPPQPVISSKANPAEAVANLIFLTFELFDRASASASAVRPSNPSNIVNCGGTPFVCGIAIERAAVAMVSVTGVVPTAVTDVGLKVQVLAAGRPLQANVTAPRLPL
jgi:hypothetical protein